MNIMGIVDLTADFRLVPSREVLLQQIDGEAVLLHMTLGEYYGLNPSGTMMWQALVESPSLQAAYERLIAEYDVEPDVLKQDLIRLVDDLVAHALVQLDPT